MAQNIWRMKFGNTNILIIFVKLTNGMQEMKRHIFCACTLCVMLKDEQDGIKKS